MPDPKPIALIAGGGRGIGRNVALTLAQAGHPVGINFKSDETSAYDLVAAIHERGGKAFPILADITTAAGCSQTVEACQAQYGPPGICIIGPGGGWHPQPVSSLSAPEALQDLHDEVAPLYHLFPLVLPRMIERRWGRIVTISLHSRRPSPSYAYDVAKAARTAAALRCEDALWKRGVTINVVSPGPVSNPDSLTQAIEMADRGSAWAARSTPTAQDIAYGIAFLCSDAARFITGTELLYSFR